MAYYFTADPAHKPVVEVDYPKIPVTLENLGGDQWRFILDASNQVLAAGSVLPNVDGWQIRVHYEDWTDYKFINDWSADHNIGTPAQNTKIVVYDLNDNIIWGIEPSAYKSVDEGLVPQPAATLACEDNVIFGSVPTVERCKSFNEPNLMTPQYTWNFFKFNFAEELLSQMRFWM